MYLITEDYRLDRNICENKDLVRNLSQSTNAIYKQIKKNEQPPENTKNYLFHGIM